MKSSAVRLAKSYTPMIKFVGTKHPMIDHPNKIIPHPCTINNMLPGSQDCISVQEYLKNIKPFVVVPFKQTPKQTTKGSGRDDASRYVYFDRPLKDNEVSAISDLPERFRPRTIDEIEVEFINNGGVM
ncbi:alpha-ketoglutarate dehydrogenase subunit KGD4 NDAI_0B06300 [Naumovozyma dairenensis CBS 421]|uniref:37S ribosomal protein YMR-31, mitochondrial n=1 Tax=Naumovozyma dairenensis (strain ATCC 10597 / BCRC 20456 / CBS 421 / NBRC 0211 / NRRL Y-12639) TaxID=1071378 RepID=G0W7A0_NAUDC|nr:hypothetical protein NDAI_0B06300 [Naumovozyma dairenensis CBS 421]CCD23661.1 hypothetical protein NDAI_0B06300 [Naumovozyma dairenensis CBS 421]